jgi:hypothetical protein
MNEGLVKAKRIDWEEFGFKTTLECNEEVDAIAICGHHLHAFEAQLQPELSSLNRTIRNNGNRGDALHQHLYDRPIPVNDAAMLTHQSRVRTAFVLAALAAGTCFASNFIMFWLMDWGIGAFLAAIAITALPLGFGHLVYERVLSGHKGLQTAIIVVIAALGFGALYQFGQARQTVMDKASGQSATRSYVDEGTADNPIADPRSQDDSESKINGTLGRALFLVSMAAELALGFLVGLFLKLRTDEDYAAWCKLKEIHELIMKLEERVADLFSRIEIAKKQCMAGIRRARSMRSKKRIPYHKALAVFLFFAFFRIPISHSQTTQHQEGILIDASSSISREGKARNLFQEYLRSTKKLLVTEPANSRVWVSNIATDSFGEAHEIVRGWTPEAHGVFTDDLDRARRQLAINFEAKSASVAPTASSTDIFGGLWHMKALFEASPLAGPSSTSPKTVWIFSDMMNETRDFPMPQLIEIGPERMLERAKANRLLVPLEHYKIYVYGASPVGLTPHSWLTVKRFWEMYFAAAGAELVIYSTECDVQR